MLAEVPLLATVPRAEVLLEMAGRQTAGIVSTAAGSGAIIAAVSIGSRHAPAAAPSPRPANHIAAALTSSESGTASADSNPASTATSSSTTGQNPSAAQSLSSQPTTGESTQGDGHSGSTPSTATTVHRRTRAGSTFQRMTWR